MVHDDDIAVDVDDIDDVADDGDGIDDAIKLIIVTIRIAAHDDDDERVARVAGV